jgi:hypothetical protein
MAVAQLALGFKGPPNNAARAAFEGFPGAEVVRRALAALRKDTDDKEEPGDDDEEDWFIVTQDNNTKDNKTSGGNAPKVQQGSNREAHQKNHKEAHHPAYEGGGTLGLSLDGKDGETGAPDARTGSLPINKGGKTRAPNARQGSLSSNALKANQKTDEAADHPACLGGGMHRWASEGGDEKARAPKARQAEDAEAWVQAKRGYEDAPYVATQKKPNHVAHQGGGTRSPQVLTVLFGSAALFVPTAGGKKKGKTGQGISAANFLLATRKPIHEPHHGSGMRSPQVLAALFSLAASFGSTTKEKFQGKTVQGVSAANFLPTQGPQYKKEAAIAHGVHGPRHSHQVGGALSTKNQWKTGQGISAANFLPSQEPYNLESDTESEAKDAPGDTLDTSDQAAMRILADNRSVRSTTASRLARATTTTEATPNWTSIGANYAAWMRALRRDPANPEAAINKDAPKRAYLAIMNGAKHMSVLYHLHQWKTPN